MTPFQHRQACEQATMDAQGAYSLCWHLSYPYIVALYRGTQRAVAPFNSLEDAKRFADSQHALAFVYAAKQVTRTQGGMCYLRADQRQPLYKGSAR